MSDDAMGHILHNILNPPAEPGPPYTHTLDLAPPDPAEAVAWLRKQIGQRRYLAERTVEIGTLRAMGMRSRAVACLFLAEGALLGALGTGLGCLLGMASAFAVNCARISWTPPNYSEKVLLTIQLFDDPGLIGYTALALAALSMLSAVVPARRAGRIPVVEALRHV